MMPGRPLTAIDTIAEAYLDDSAALDPVAATEAGIPGHDHRLPELDPAWHEERSRLRRRTLEALAAAEPADAGDRITAAALRGQLEAAEELHDAGEDLSDLDNLASPQHAIRGVFDLMPTASAQDWATVAARLGAVPFALRGYVESLRAAAGRGHVVPRRQVAAAIVQCADYGRPDGFFGALAAGARTQDGPLPDALTAGLGASAAAAAAAYGELGAFLRDELMARAPARDAVGRDVYALHSRAFLGTRIDLDETYDWGQRELAGIGTDMDATAREIRPDASVEAAIAHLDAAPEHTLDGTDALRDWMQATSDAAIDALADRHFDIPAPVRRLECLIAPTEEGGIYYTHPTADLTTRPGRMWWSVPPGETRFSTWRERSTVYHEGVPGHHLQIAQTLYRSDVLNRWRRIGSLVSGHAEGWALYAERLMVELGYLDSPADRLGALDQQSLRAARVVLDIGVHCDLPAPAEVGGGRWDYGKAWQFLRAHSRMSEPILRYELDRYLGWPGQAPSYKIGERHWLQLRERARAAEGAAFDLKSFHRRALDIGSVGLDVLQAAISELPALGISICAMNSSKPAPLAAGLNNVPDSFPSIRNAQSARSQFVIRSAPLTPVLVSVNVGLPKNVSWQGKTVYTGVWKRPVDGPAMVRRLNIDGDGQGDLGGHGGEQRAVLVYQIDSYRHWQRHFGRDDFGYGQFGENLTVDGLPDDEVCIGDRYRIGEAEFEVTQPRVTCYRVGLRMGEPELPALLVGHHRPGFYMRVITEGHVQAGDPIVKTRTGPHALSVADTDALLYLPGRDRAKLRLAVQIPALSPGWQGSFRDLLAEAAGASAAGPAWPGFRELRVAKVVQETAAVTSIYLTAADGAPLPAARAGQYLTLKITGAAQPAPVRSYSLSQAPDAGTYRISVKQEPHGAASRYLNQNLQSGTLLEVAAPRGDFVLDEGTGPVLLISAGIGVTPVLAMLHQLAAQHSERDIWWLNADRGPDQHPLGAEAHALLAALPRAREHVFYSTVDGRLTKEKLAGLGLPADASAYICGPASFMTDMAGALTAIGVDPARIHTELFGALTAINPGLTGQRARPPHQPPAPPGTGPQVTFARSGIAAAFGNQGRSVLDLADACDVPTRWSCRTGVCHTCITPLLSGDITYSPDPLEPPAGGQILICCAQPVTDIVLDM